MSPDTYFLTVSLRFFIVSCLILFILILIMCCPSSFFFNSFWTLLFAVITVVARMDYFFLWSDSKRLVAMKEVWVCFWFVIRYFYGFIFYFIMRASLYLPSLTSRFFLYSNSMSLVEVKTEYLLLVLTNLSCSLSKDLFLVSIVWLTFLFVWSSKSPIYEFHSSSNTLYCLSWLSYISWKALLFYTYIFVTWRSIYFPIIFLIFLSISLAYTKADESSYWRQLFLNWANTLTKVIM